MKLIPINTGFLSISRNTLFLTGPEVAPGILLPETDPVICTIRSLLIINGSQHILIDAGVGTLVPQAILSPYDYRPEGDWESLLNPHGLSPESITDVILTHLHFDHCGGCVWSVPGFSSPKDLILTFPNASHWISREQWEWAQNAADREPDSFVEHTFLPIRQHNRLELVEKETEIIPGIHVRFFHGHTHGLMIPVIESEGETVVFAGDLIPTTAHLPVDNIMAYDRDPSLSRLEKRQLLTEAKAKGWMLFLQHDNYAVFEKEF